MISPAICTTTRWWVVVGDVQPRCHLDTPSHAVQRLRTILRGTEKWDRGGQHLNYYTEPSPKSPMRRICNRQRAHANHNAAQCF